jgi:hypothetical protein
LRTLRNWKWLMRLLDVHSPTGHVLGTCWCAKKKINVRP